MASLEFLLPDVGEGLAEGEIVRWHIAPGQTVKADQLLVEVETDKAIVEIPAPVAGVLKNRGGEAGDKLAVGAVLAVFEVQGESSPKTVASDLPGHQSATKGGPAPENSTRVRASPAVRKAARERGIDLQRVRGTGSRGQITACDLETASGVGLEDGTPSATSPRVARKMAPPEGSDRVEPLSGLRRRIAQTMEQAWREVPHIFNLEAVDASQLVAARESLNHEMAESGVKLSYMPFLVKACVMALKANPSFNASIDTTRNEIIYRHRCNIGIATATEEGLLVPVLHDADQLTLVEIASELAVLSERARARKATVQQLSGGTFTISNFGSYGGGVGMPIIRPPEVAIAGFGRIHEAVLVEGGKPVVKAVLPVVVSTDHRLNDGVHLGAFVATLTRYLREPVRLLGHL